MNDIIVERLDKWIFYALCGMAFTISFSIAIGNIFLGLAVPAFLARLYYKRDDLADRIRRIDKGVKYTIAAFFGVTVMSWISGGCPLSGIRILSSHMIFHVLPFFMLLVIGHEKKQLYILAVLLFISITINNCATVFQFFRAGVWNRFPGLSTRLTAATFMLLMFPVLLEAFFKLNSFKYRAITVFLLMLNGLAFLLNGARGAWMAAMVLIPVAMLLSKAKKSTLLAVVFLLVISMGGTYYCVPWFHQRVDSVTVQSNQSRDERFRMWKSAYNMFLDYPLLGVGVGNYSDAYTNKYIMPDAKEPNQGHAHSHIMHYLGERGALGTGAFLVMFGYIIYYALAGWRRTGFQAYYLIFILLGGFFLYGITDTLFRTAIVPKFFWLALAMCLRWIQLEKVEKL